MSDQSLVSSWSLAWRLARRELRAGTRGFRVLIACLALGVFAIAAAGSVGEAARETLSDNGRLMLGGDLEARLVYRSLNAAERDAFAAHGRLSTLYDMRAMAVNPAAPGGGATALSELAAVDDAYPLVGTLTLAPAVSLPEALARQPDGSYGVVIEPALADRLGVKAGDHIGIGQASLTVTAEIVSAPDGAATPLAFGPRALISRAALPATQLIQPGSLVAEVTHLAITDGSSPAALVEALNKQFPDSGWQLRTPADAAPALKGVLDVVGQFLTFVGLTALLIGGVGVANAITAFVEARAASIATLKCLGAPSRLVFRLYGLQIAVLAGAGVLIGLIAGALVPPVIGWASAHLAATSLAVLVPSGPFPVSLVTAAAFGVLTTVAFALGPLGTVRRIQAAALYRSASGLTEAGRRHVVPTGAPLWAMIGLAALAIVAVPRHDVAVWFVLGTLVTLLLFQGVTLGLQALARAVRKRGRGLGTVVRMALANLYRPGNPARSIILSLGVGTTVLVSVVLTEATLNGAIDDRLPKTAPAFYVIDIQGNQRPAFTDAVSSVHDGSIISMADMVRGRIVRLKGQPIVLGSIAPDSQWAVKGDRGFSTAAAMPEHTDLASGQWWPADYKGPPLVSVTADLAKGLKLSLGDTVTFNILGREITATVASTRRVDWSSLSMSFAFLLSPGILEHAPRTFIATVAVPPEGEQALQRAVTASLPNATAINVRAILAAVGGMLQAAGRAVEASAVVTLTAGVLVLAASIAAGHRRRVTEAVVLQVLGARRRQIMTIHLIEFALLGTAAGMVAAVVGTVSAWALSVYILHIDWQFRALPVVATVLSAAVLAALAGALATWRALSVKPARRLREEDMSGS